MSQAVDGILDLFVSGVQKIAFLFSSRRRHTRSEEHTSELQSPSDIVCRLLLKKKTSLTRRLRYHPCPFKSSCRRSHCLWPSIRPCPWTRFCPCKHVFVCPAFCFSDP